MYDRDTELQDADQARLAASAAIERLAERIAGDVRRQIKAAELDERGEDYLRECVREAL